MIALGKALAVSYKTKYEYSDIWKPQLPHWGKDEDFKTDSCIFFGGNRVVFVDIQEF